MFAMQYCNCWWVFDSHIKRHSTCKNHTQNMESAKKNAKIRNFVVSDTETSSIAEAAKKLEMKLSLFIAEHNFFRIGSFKFMLKKFYNRF